MTISTNPSGYLIKRLYHKPEIEVKGLKIHLRARKVVDANFKEPSLQKSCLKFFQDYFFDLAKNKEL